MRRTAALALLAGLGLAAACAGSLDRPAPEKLRFVLAPGVPAAGSTLAGSVWVDRVRVSPLFDGKGFVLRTGESTYTSDFYHEWFAPPGELVRDALFAWLDAGALFRSVERSSAANPDWLLESEFDALHADLRDASAPRVVLSARFRLLDLRGPRPQRRLESRREEVEAAADASPQALVDAWNRALARVFSGLEQELGAALRATGGAPAR